MSFSENILSWAWNTIKAIPQYFSTLAEKDLEKIGTALKSNIILYYKSINYGAWTLPAVIIGLGVTLIGTFAVFMLLNPIREVE